MPISESHPTGAVKTPQRILTDSGYITVASLILLLHGLIGLIGGVGLAARVGLAGVRSVGVVGQSYLLLIEQ
jgi:hypothetical protein